MNAIYSLNEKFEVVTTGLFSELKKETGCDNSYIDEMRGEVRFTKGEVGVVFNVEDSAFNYYAYSHNHERTMTGKCQSGEIKALIVRVFSELS